MNTGFVLLAEDRPGNAEPFVRVLRMNGVENEVVVARDGVEALDFLIVLDMYMPRIDGLETLRRIRADERTSLLPVVMFSSSDLPQDTKKLTVSAPTAMWTR